MVHPLKLTVEPLLPVFPAYVSFGQKRRRYLVLSVDAGLSLVGMSARIGDVIDRQARIVLQRHLAFQNAATYS